MKYLSVCSGIEAASVAFNPLGWEAVGFSEIEAFPIAVLKHHYPDVPVYGDFRELIPNPPMCDMLCGGTPCQAFSVAGLRNSLSDDRGNLTLQFILLANAIDHLRHAAGLEPGWVLWENVPGVLSTRDNAFGAFLGGLCGSDGPIPEPAGGWTGAGVVDGPTRCAAWRILDAQHFGLAQRRKRVFVLARGGAGRWAAADALLPIIEGSKWHPAPGRKAGKGVAPTISARTKGSGGLGTDFDCDGGLIANALTERPDRGGGNSEGQRLIPTVASASDLRVPGSETPIRASGDNSERTLADVPRMRRGCGSVGRGEDIACDGGLIAENASGLPVHGVRGGERGDVVADVRVVRQRADLVPEVAGTMKACAQSGGFSNSADHAAASYMVPVAIQGNMIGRADDAGPAGSGHDDTGTMFTLTKTDVHGVAAPMLIRMREGKEGGGKGPLVSNDQSLTLATANDQVLATVGTLACNTGPNGHDAGNFQSNQGVDAGYVQPVGMQVRRLTPRECERLQGFPDDYTLIPLPMKGRQTRQRWSSDGSRYKALGNSWAVPCVRYIAERIKAVM